jgi:hypothetical protein
MRSLAIMSRSGKEQRLMSLLFHLLLLLLFVWGRGYLLVISFYFLVMHIVEVMTMLGMALRPYMLLL